jgi:hypothetical protein
MHEDMKGKAQALTGQLRPKVPEIKITTLVDSMISYTSLPVDNGKG